MSDPNSRVARIFLSSTFRDFGEERDLLVRKVFPALRARLRDRFVELVDVDLRWGITVEQAERGEVLPICLAEIDRARPFFVGMLGDRYGWIPPADAYAPDLLERQGWLEAHRGGKSVTELEILHGVLNEPEMAGRAFFYFRSAEYAKAKGGDYVAASDDDAARQRALKDRIRTSGFPVVEDYPDPEAFARRLEEDLWAVLDETFPVDEVPDAFERESRKHEAYAAPRRRLYLGGERYVAALNALLAGGAQRILVEGQSGGGKSALLANWLGGHGRAHPTDLVHAHYTGASAEAADPLGLVRRLCEAIKRAIGSSEEIAGDPQKLMEGLPLWLANASAYGAKENVRWVIVLHALNGLTGLRDLRWLPAFLPERVYLVVSCLPSEVMEALETKGEWSRVEVAPLTGEERRDLLAAYLARYNKTLPADLADRALSHSLAANPLFLRTMAEELRVFGHHQELERCLAYYLTSGSIDDLFEKVMERVEGDCGEARVRTALTGIWASRAGLNEEEILGYANLVPATWAPIRHALDEALLESGGRLTFAHDYVRIAVTDRYLAGNGTLLDEGQSEEALARRRATHTRLAKWFEAHAFQRQVHEEDRASTQAETSQTNDGQDEDLPRAIAANPLQAVVSGEPATSGIGGAVASTPSARPAAAASVVEETPVSLSSIMISDARAAEEIPHQWRQARKWARLKDSLTTRRMFEAVSTYRSNEEHLSYWLDLEREAGADIETDYEAAWNEWAPDNNLLQTAMLASGLQGFLSYAGRYTFLAERLARLSLSICEKNLGADDLESAECMDKLAILLQTQGKYSDAEKLFRRCLSITEPTLGKMHPRTAAKLDGLAGLLTDLGDYVAAEPLYLRALEIANAVDPSGYETGFYLNNLACLYDQKGDLEKASCLFKRALAIAERYRGPCDPLIASRLDNLAQQMSKKGEHISAEVLYRRALYIRESVLGPFHPETGITLNNLAFLLLKRGEIPEAEAFGRRDLSILEHSLGPDHPDTGISVGNLARILQSKGDLDGAEPLWQRAVEIHEVALGPKHPLTRTSIFNLANLYVVKGDSITAERLFSCAERGIGTD